MRELRVVFGVGKRGVPSCSKANEPTHRSWLASHDDGLVQLGLSLVSTIDSTKDVCLIAEAQFLYSSCDFGPVTEFPIYSCYKSARCD